MSFSNYMENELLDHLFGKGAYTPPTIYVGLSTADPGEDASGLAEPSGGAYARVSTAASDWTTASAGALSNANEISFPEATGSWGTLTHFAVFDALSGGNMLGSGALNASQAVASGNTVSFQAGDLDVTLD